ncbi:MAG: 6-bladed beta-propeller, partial [Bacteroidales bacterium]
YLERIRFIPLEPHPGSLFAQADKMLLEGGDLFILDKTLKALLCFDTTGRFRYRIQRVGQGPGEYPELNGFWIRPDRDELFLHCRMPPKILVFDLEGNFLRETAADHGAQEMVGLGEGLSAGFSILNSYSRRDSVVPGIFLIRENGSFIRQVKRIGERTVYWTFGYQRHWEPFEGGALVLSQSDTVYHVGPDGRVSIDFTLDPGPMRMPDEIRRVPFNSAGAEDVFRGAHMQAKDQLVAFGPIRLFWFTRENQQFFALIDKRSGTGHYSQAIQNSLCLFPTVFPGGSGHQDELAGIYNLDVIWLLKESLESSRAEHPGNRALDEVEKIIGEAIANDRPIVYIANIKKEWIK